MHLKIGVVSVRIISQLIIYKKFRQNYLQANAATELKNSTDGKLVMTGIMREFLSLMTKHLNIRSLSDIK